MGQEIKTSHFSSSDFENFKKSLDDETQYLKQLFIDNQFSSRDLMAGYEMEAWLIDKNAQPSPSNESFLKMADSPLLTSELAQFNVEINADPDKLKNKTLSNFEKAFKKHWQYCQTVAEKILRSSPSSAS